jgi:hypothetical protein
LDIHHGGQDSGDMGAIHAAGVNIVGEYYINYFEQIIIDDTKAIAGMNDHHPDGIFLDWPSRSTDQNFANVEITNSQGSSFRSNGTTNESTATVNNVSWRSGFDQQKMRYGSIGLNEDFPFEYTTSIDLRNFADWGTNTSWSQDTRLVHVLDVNGDGMSDLFMQHVDGRYTSQLFLSTDTGLTRFDIKLRTHWETDPYWGTTSHTPHVLDVNGDGFSNVLLQSTTASGRSRMFIRF